MNFPYVCTRVRAKRSNLFDSRDYQKMSNMGTVAELLVYLGKGKYKKDVVEIPGKLDNLEILHMASFRNYGRRAMEIYHMTGDGLKGGLSPIFLKLDFLNILTVLRSKYGGIPKSEIEHLLLPAPSIRPELLLSMYNLKNEEIVNSFSNNVLMKGITGVSTHNEIENKMFFNWLISIKKLKGLKIIKNFINEMLFVQDVLNLMKARAYNQPIDLFLTRNSKKFSSINDSEDLFREVMSHFNAPSAKPWDLETHLESTLLRSSSRLMRLNPISVAPIVSYIFAKEIEARNVRSIGFGLWTGMSPEEIQGELIYEGGRGS